MYNLLKKLSIVAIILVVIWLVLPIIMSGSKYDKELANIFPQKEKTTASYIGLAEYGHKVTIKDIKTRFTVKTYKIEGYIDDARGEDINKRKFKVTYTIKKDEVKEVVVNNDEFRLKGKDDTINSILPNQIILKTPLKVGTSWKQTFTYKGKDYKATTKIIKVLEVKKNHKQYTTKLVVNNIPGFFDNKYTEERTYETGKGLISFKNTMKVYDIAIGRELTADDYLFGYSQQNLKIPK